MLKRFTIHQKDDQLTEDELTFVRNVDQPEDVEQAYIIERKIKDSKNIVVCTIDFDGIPITNFLKYLIGEGFTMLNDELFSSLVNTYGCAVLRSRDKATLVIRPAEFRKDLEAFRGKEVFWFEW